MSLDQDLRIERVPAAAARPPIAGRRHPGRPRVVAVVHGRDPEHLAAVLAAVAAQTVRPDVLVGVDAGEDGEAGERVSDMLRAHADEVLRLAPSATLADAVTAALVHRGAAGLHPGAASDGEDATTSDWVWVLDDRERPSMRALERLVDRVRRSDNVRVVGAKHRGGPDGSVLVDAGFTTTRGGRRLTRIDAGEVDQGQRDATSDVLAVGLGGMLVHAGTWQSLGGPDAALLAPGRTGAEVDLCRRARLAGHRVEVVPGAVMVRPAADGTTAPTDRRSTAHLRLTGAAPLALPLVAAQLLLGALVRVLLGLAAKEPRSGLRAARQVMAALLRPDLVWRARRAARRTAVVRRSQLQPLLADRRETWRWHRDRWHRTRPGGSADGRPGARRALVDPVGVRMLPADDGRGRIAGPATLALVLGAASALALWRLIGPGSVSSAALPPVPGALGSLVDALAADWVPAGLGSPGAADAALWPLLAVSLPFTSPALAVTVLLLASPPLAALTAWWGAGALTRSPWWRALAALAWAAAPVLLLSTSAGRYGAVMAHVALPVAARLLAHGAGTPHRRLAWAWSAGAALALVPVVTGAPVLLVPAALAGLAAAIGSVRLAPALVAVPSAVLLLPTLGEAVRLPAVLLASPGTPAASTPPAAWQVLLGWPSTPAPGALVAAGLPSFLVLLVGAAPVVLGVVALGRSWTADRRGLAVRTGLVVTLLGTVAAVVAAAVVVGVGADGEPVTGWAGPGTSLALLGLLVAGLAGLGGPPDPAAAASRARTALRVGTPVALVLLVLAPVAATTAWVADQVRAPAAGDLERRTGRVVPAVVADAATSPDQVRSLVVQAGQGATGPDGLPALEVAVVRGTGPALDRAAAAAQVRQTYRPAADDPATAALDLAVGNLVTGRGDARIALAPFGVGAVVLLLPDGPDDPGSVAVAGRLDAVEGLTSAGETPASRAWRVQPASGASASAPDRPAAVRVLDAADGTWAALPSLEREVDTRLPDGDAGRVLALAERAHPAWTATLDGVPLEPVLLDGWAQGFTLPAGDGHLVVRQGPASGPVVLGWQLVVLLVTALLAVPVRPTRGRS